MTQARFFAREGERLLRVTGHAGLCPGNDVLCAGISALVCALSATLAALERRGEATLLENRLDEGDARLAARGGALVTGAFAVAALGLRLLAEEYPEHVRLDVVTLPPAENEKNVL